MKNASLPFIFFAGFLYFLTHLASALRYKLLSRDFSLSSYFSSHMKAMPADVVAV